MFVYSGKGLTLSPLGVDWSYVAWREEQMRGQRRETIPMSKYWREQTLTTKSELLMCLAKNTE